MNGPQDNATPAYQARRATLEDLPELKALWQQARLPAAELEKRFTEFQVALRSDGRIAGTVGLQIHKQHGLIHSEVFSSPEIEPDVRSILWQRILAVAKNNGLARLWTLPTTSFYREQGMSDVDETLLAKIPGSFGNPATDWISLKLKDENQSALLAEKEFEVFAQAQRVESERLISQARAFRLVAYIFLLLALGGVAALAYLYSRVSKRKR